jgi:CMP-N,N'-diacetyllegionaminic acid synthase
MEKVIAMIPARAGSKRVPKKNIRLINGKPLISYIIEATLGSKRIDEVFVNTDDEIIKALVRSEFPSVKIYNRPEKFASDSATNDDFMFDFMSNVKTNHVIQLLATSPFVTSEQIDLFIEKYLDNQLDTLISTKKNQIECLYNSKPINFDSSLHTLPSQLLEPVYSYACSLMMWNSSKFIENFTKNLGAYHGGNGKIGHFVMDGYSTIDIDNEDDFMIAEVVAEKISKGIAALPKFYQPINDLIKDADVVRILAQDGVMFNVFDQCNKLCVDIKTIIESMPTDKSWSYTLVNTESNRATLIAQLPGEGNRRHFHDKWDEWWYIVQGNWEFEYNDRTEIVSENSVVLIQRNNIHKITAIGEKMSIRLAVSRDDVDHIYTNTDYN